MRVLSEKKKKRKRRSVWEYQWARCAADRIVTNNGWNWISVIYANTSCCDAYDLLTNHSNNSVFYSLIQCYRQEKTDKVVGGRHSYKIQFKHELLINQLKIQNFFFSVSHVCMQSINSSEVGKPTM